MLIIADDLGWNDVGYHGSKITTPALDRLANEGVRLERHYVFSVCSPTRTALLTGRNPSRYGILTPIGGRSEQSIPRDTATLATTLAAAGYHTAISGKWHLGLRPEVGPRQFGFTESYGYLHGQVDPYNHLYKNGDRTWHRNDQFIEEPGHATDLIAGEAVRVIEAQRNRPWFLYVAFSVPHTPLAEEEKWVQPYAEKFPEESRRMYAASVSHMDAAIGRMVESLERTGQRQRTLLVFTSDNGGQKSAGKSNDYEGRYPAAPVLADNTPLRGWKGDVYEGGIRVPALAVWPGVLPPSTCEAVLCAMDWYPTIAARAGAKLPDNVSWDGQNAWDWLAGSQPPAARQLYWKTPQEVALREGDWKLIAQRKMPDQVQLFNLAADPLEKQELSALEPARVARLKQLLAEQQQRDP